MSGEPIFIGLFANIQEDFNFLARAPVRPLLKRDRPLSEWRFFRDFSPYRPIFAGMVTSNAADPYPVFRTFLPKWRAQGAGLAHHFIVRLAIWLLAGVACAIVIPEALEQPRPFPVDFNYLWAAGKLWAAFETPYSSDYNAFMATTAALQYAGPPVQFFYPPNSILMTAPFGFLPYREATIVFGVANLLALALSSLLFALTLRKAGAARTILYPMLLHIGLIGAAWTAARPIFAYNAPMLIAYAALMLTIYGAAAQRLVPVTVGLIFILMKPQIGIPLCVACLFSPSLRPGAIAAIAATGVLSLIGLAPGGFIAPLQFFLENVAAYGEHAANQPDHTSGLGFALYGLGIDLSAFYYLAAALAGAAIVSRLYAVKMAAALDRDFALIAIGVVTASFFLPSHNNYYIALTPVFFWLAKDARIAELALWLPGAALMMRGWDIAFLFHEEGTHEFLFTISLTDTVGVSLVFLASILTLRRRAGARAAPVRERLSMADETTAPYETAAAPATEGVS